MRRALIAGVDYYEHIGGLHGCVSDARAVKRVLERNFDGSLNFDVRLLVATSSADLLSKNTLKDGIKEVFAGDCEAALFYFAGHGHVETAGGYLLASDSSRGDDSVSLAEVMNLANAGDARNKIIILDSCHSGVAGSRMTEDRTAELTEGMTILTASTEDQYASEENGGGVFTSLLVDALSGAACNLVGDVTPGGVYAHIDESLGPWEQRPVFKTNVKNFVSLRKVQAPIALGDLHRLTELFPRQGHVFGLDPSFEPERSGHEPPSVAPPNPANTERFAVLQKYNRVRLVVPVDAPHMWHAAMSSKGCKLTPLGEHYRRLVEKGRL